MIKVTDNHGPRLQRVTPARVMPALGEELVSGAGAIVEYARVHINEGSASGKAHVPSAPGEFPNSDTHELEQSLHVGEVVETPTEIRTSAIADAPHAAYVEQGTSKMEPRPYMVPSTEANRAEILEALFGRYNRMLRGG